MNAPGNWTTSTFTTGAQENKMGSTDNGPNRLAEVDQEIKDTRYWEEKVAAAMRRVSRRLAAGKPPANSLEA